LLWPDDGVDSLDIQGTPNHQTSFDHRTVHPQAAINGNELWINIQRDLEESVFSEEFSETWKLEIVRKFGNTKLVSGMVVLGNEGVVECTKAVNAHNIPTIREVLGTRGTVSLPR
jgi:hypothetical protein